MLRILVRGNELYDEKKEEFILVKPTELQLEHSLLSLSKWESKWCKPFLSRGEKTIEETLDYIRCMTINQGVDPSVYRALTSENLDIIKSYIDSPMSATRINDNGGKPSREIITSELIYYWMISCNIPFECQKWHLNRLLTLIRVCNIKTNPGKKMSKSEILSQNAMLNAKRKAAYGTKG